MAVEMTLTDVLMVCATLLSPVIAVQVTRFLDDKKEEKERRLQVFKTLMATRGYVLSPAHVEALNRIDLEFSSDTSSDKAVMDVWLQYLDHLGVQNMDPEAWGLRRLDLLVDLLHAMGLALGYGFNKTQIKNGTYAPVAHGRVESEQERLRTLCLELLDGKRALPVQPLSPEQSVK